MPQYQRKPTIIDAIQYDGTNASNVINFCGNKVSMSAGKIIIHAVTGNFELDKDHYVIRIDGDIHIRTKDAFESSFDIILP